MIMATYYIRPVRAAIAPSATRFYSHYKPHHLSRNVARSTINKQQSMLNLHQHHIIQLRSMSVYGFGQQWSGALSRGSSALFLEEAPELSPEELQQFGDHQNMIPLNGIANDKRCVGASAGWGHTALLVADKSSSTTSYPQLMVCGRPHDFQTLMRLRRLPPFMRNFCIKHTVPTAEENHDNDNDPLEPSVLQRVASYFAGENNVTFYEKEARLYGNLPTLLEIELPNGEIPALEGDELDIIALESHASTRVAREDGDISKQQQTPFLTHFQSTLASGAGVTAVISKTGRLYIFGLNHRGQCGVGSYSPNIWKPTQVSSLATTRFILDHASGMGEEMYKNFKEQQYPIVSVALGLQHGVALDSEGQVFSWGKGERGQLGQGRRMTHEDYNEDEQHDAVEEEGDAPTENRTFEYALHVSNFYDPFATTASASSDDVYTPLLSQNDAKVRLISAGMNFTLAVTNSNLPYIWGKNICLNPSYSETSFDPRAKPVQDSTYPRYIPGLPSDLRIERVSCGTHHASFLLEDGSVWAVGIATDTPAPLWDEAVEILAPGVVDMDNLASFNAGFDRTTVVSGKDKRQIIEVQLWSIEELREQGAVRPSWVDWLENNEGGSSEEKKVCSVHRGWMHTIVVTK